MATNRMERLLTERQGRCVDGDIEARLDALREHVPNQEGVATDTRMLGCLADETRYRLVRVLHVADEACCVCELTPLLDVSDSAVSHALSDLDDAGLVERRKDGKWRYYRTTDRADRLLRVLGADNRTEVAS